MSRYLTPAKIGLLVVIELYTESIIPLSSTIPIVSFVFNQLIPSTNHESLNSTQNLSLVLDLKSFESVLEAHPATSNLSDRTLWDHFLKKLWDIDSLDALHVFFSRRASLLSKTREEVKKDIESGINPPSEDMILLSRTSPFGSFVRKSQVEFERLKFNDCLRLWMNFVKWRCDSKIYWASKNPDTRRWIGDKALDEGEDEWGTGKTEELELIAYEPLKYKYSADSAPSTDDIEKLLEFQVEKMQKFGNRLPHEVRTRFQSVLDHCSLIPSLSHYLIFLDSWRSGDYPTSFDSLHRYFDYTMQNRDRLFYQYALMNLAVLQADFSCFDEAVAAMLETVSTARENKDMACLNFALNWLYHFGKAHPKIIAGTELTSMLGDEREGLSFLRIKAKETGMWNLWSSSLLSEAKLGMTNGESLANAFENIIKSSQLILDKNIKAMMGSQMVMQSSIWARLGISHLSKQYCEIFLSCYARYASFDDVLRFTCRIVIALGEKGCYDDAFAILESLDMNSLRSWKANQYWLTCKGILRLKRDLRNNNLDGASQLLGELLQQNGEDADTELSFEITMLHVDYLMRRADYSQALAKIEEVSSTAKKNNDDVNMRISLLVSKALLYNRAGRPQRGFSIALRAASIAWRAMLLHALWAAMGAVAIILTSLTEFQAAAQILEAVLPRALECDNCALSAQLYSFLIDAYVGLAGQAKSEVSRRDEYLMQSLKFIDRALNEYSALEDVLGQCEMMAKKATIFRVIGKLSLANECAKTYMDLKKQAKENQ
ncbi:hypothetical protein K3495_g5805 [Podosphaera aphanis]|nr:hypothetical protein K3495_g5805 [Podosphaera aphanis]